MSQGGVPEALRGVVQAGLDRQEASDWVGAAQAWKSLQRAAHEQGHAALELDAWVRLADVLRRADQPRQALQALENGLAADPDPVQRSLLLIQSSALLLDTGHLLSAEARVRAVLDHSEGPLRSMALDTLAATLAIRGDRLGLGEVVLELENMGPGPGALAARFRRARLERLEGHLDACEVTLAALADSLSNKPKATGAVAAAITQLAQLALLRGRFQDAELLLRAADEGWEDCGRYVGRLEVLALRAELATQRGALTFLPGWLDKGVAYAAEREMVLLEARLRGVRGACRSMAGSETGHADLDSALLLAERAGAPFLSGRLRLERARLGFGEQGRPVVTLDVECALEELTGDRIWAARARVLLAKLLLDKGQNAQGLEHAAAALCQFKASGLEFDEGQARKVLDRS
ncbi:MAG: tetratricopeptide (TPR) repeat protein [Cognaticolwellia sp.]|jgi:tetratricopeptide (TPR) repeat protein